MFTFTDVTPPYDIYTVGAENAGGSLIPTVFYVQGLTRAEPVVSAPELQVGGDPPFNSTTISGTTMGGNVANELLVAWDGGGHTASRTGTYSFDATWQPATETTTGALYGFQFSRKTNGHPDVFTGYASSGLVTLTGKTVTQGPVPATINLNLARPPNAALTGKITPPIGFSTPFIVIKQQIGTSGEYLDFGVSRSSIVDATIPIVSAGKAELMAFSSSTVNNSTVAVYPGLNASVDLTYAMPAPSVQIGPPDGALGITSNTVFTWSAAENTIYQATFITTDVTGTAHVHYQIQTTSTTTHIPTVPEIVFPNGQSFLWWVRASGRTRASMT